MVSVVIPVFNSAAWIKEAIDSILAQTFPVLEILVVDDGSIDETAKIVQTYGGPVVYLYQEHCGVSAARNRAIAAAHGDCIAFIDGDDYWHPNKIEAQIKLLNQDGLAWVSCETQPFDSNTRQHVNGLTLPMRDGAVLEALLMNNFIGSATPIVRRSVFEHVGYFNEAYEARIGEDWDMWLRIAAFYPLGVVYGKLAFQRLHSESTMSSTTMKEKVRSLIGVVERVVNQDPERLSPLKHRALANVYYNAGVQLIKLGQYKDARGYFFSELKYRPLKIESWIYLLMSIMGPGLSKPFINLKQLLRKR
jgi:glycosyltransferase involved in cell wall biosynthesis